MKLIPLGVIMIFLSSVSAGRAQIAISSPEKDVPGSKDSRLLARIEGSYISYYKKAVLDDLRIALDRITFDYDRQQLNDFRTRVAHGTHETIVYVLPGNISTARAMEFYERELRNHGVIQILFQGSKREKALDDGYDRFVTEIYHLDPDDPATSFMRRGGDTRYFAIRLPRPDGEFLVTFLSTVNNEGYGTIVPKERVGVRVDLVETKTEMEAERVTE